MSNTHIVNPSTVLRRTTPKKALEQEPPGNLCASDLDDKRYSDARWQPKEEAKGTANQCFKELYDEPLLPILLRKQQSYGTSIKTQQITGYVSGPLSSPGTRQNAGSSSEQLADCKQDVGIKAASPLQYLAAAPIHGTEPINGAFRLNASQTSSRKQPSKPEGPVSSVAKAASGASVTHTQTINQGVPQRPERTISSFCVSFHFI